MSKTLASGEPRPPAARRGADQLPAWEIRVAEGLRAVSPAAGLAAALALVAILGALDATVAGLSGLDHVVGVLYLVPVSLAAWSGRVRAGLAVAVIAAAAEALFAWLGDPQASQHLTRLALTGLPQLLLFAAAAAVVAALRRHLERERDLARTDPVTGLANRRAFEEAAELERLRARRSLTPISLAYVDLDGFKAVNDTLGHFAGDRVLRTVGEALRTAVRETDQVARLGGDEFGLRLPGAQPDAASAVGNRIRARMAAHQRERPAVSASIGVATFLGPPTSAEALLGAADAAMYEVKRGTKDAVSCVVIRGGEAAPAPETSHVP